MEQGNNKLILVPKKPFRLCFCLKEPAGQTEEWRVDYLLQSIADPSLYLPVQEAWKLEQTKVSFLKLSGFQARKYVSEELARAALPPAEKTHEDGFFLETEQAYRFLQQTAPRLHNQGFGLLLPKWWTGHHRPKLQMMLDITQQEQLPQGRGYFSGSQIVDFQWRAAVGDQSLSLEELTQLAELKSSLVYICGNWVEVDWRELQQVIALWHRSGGAPAMNDAMRILLEAQHASQNNDFFQLTGNSSLLQSIENLQTGNPPILKTPEGFQGTLRQYQVKGYSWLKLMNDTRMGACLADDMGLGKTIQSLALLQTIHHPTSDRASLLICPTSVLGNWQREAQQFTPGLSVMLHYGSNRDQGIFFQQATMTHDLIITSYGTLRTDFPLLREIQWSAVILDEAQNIKNHRAAQAKAAGSLNADFRLALTGTPVENDVNELWSIMEFLNPGYLGKFAEFQQEYYAPIHNHGDKEKIVQLKQKVNPFILRRLKSDKNIIRDLPEKIEIKVYCHLTREQATLYRMTVNNTMQTLRSAPPENRRGIVLSTLLRLKQICNHPAHYTGDHSALADRSGKLTRLGEIVQELTKNNERALIFTQFAEMGKLIQRYLQEIIQEPIPFLHGSISQKVRESLVADFQEENGAKIFLLSLKAGGSGLNLTKATHVIHFDRWWNPAVENQATDRAYRIGQKQNVQVRKFICAGTLEEKIDTLIESKQEMASNLIGAGEKWISELSDQDLQKILFLEDSLDFQ